jgi:hypothetical protein
MLTERNIAANGCRKSLPKEHSMPYTFQYPLERVRDLEQRWGRLLEQTAAIGLSPDWHCLAIHVSPPRDGPENEDDDDDEDEDEEDMDDREPAVIREPDKDE